MGLEPTIRALRDAKELLEAVWMPAELVGYGHSFLPPWQAHLNLVVLGR